MVKKQVHRGRISITCDLEIPQYQRDRGIEIDLSANDQLLGRLFISGAAVTYRKVRCSKESTWTFSDFAKMLDENRTY